ncbi:hypothetical protein [Winogradskyella psychrotolerans]|uniref:hypothetical protein n=1 Tax=Winogradskyella psychrotolerans TaxID=1344585 RepID=UPI0012691298|nr:hypothetical protein [Winogradskyella psychrotolerans]
METQTKQASKQYIDKTSETNIANSAIRNSGLALFFVRLMYLKKIEKITTGKTYTNCALSRQILTTIVAKNDI